MNQNIPHQEKSFSERLKEAIDKLAIKQVEFAQKIGAKPQNVNNWLAGSSEPNAQMLIGMILEFPQINWFYVFRGSEFGAVDTITNFTNASEARVALAQIRAEYESRLAQINTDWASKLDAAQNEFNRQEVILLRQVNGLLLGQMKE